MSAWPHVYHDGETRLVGSLNLGVDRLARAAVLIFPTVANITPAITRRAEMLNELGYVAFIADLYGFAPGGMEAAQSAAVALRADVDSYRRRLRAAYDAFAAFQDQHANGGRRLAIAAIGYCMGGQAALELARDGADLAAVVSFHGILETDRPAAPGAIRPRILVCHGDADPLVPREQVIGFWNEMDRAGANWHFHSYSGVRHGFTDPGSDARGIAAIGYDASADRQSWTAMTGLFDEVFGR